MNALSLSRKDHIFDICEQLMGAESQSDLRRCINGPLRDLLPHDSFACGFGTLGPDGIESSISISDGFPAGYLASISANGRIHAHSLHFWLQTRRPIAVTFTPEESSALPAEMLLAAQSAADGRQHAIYQQKDDFVSLLRGFCSAVLLHDDESTEFWPKYHIKLPKCQCES